MPAQMASEDEASQVPGTSPWRLTVRTATVDDITRPSLSLHTDASYLSPVVRSRSISSLRSPAPSVEMEELMDDIFPHEVTVRVTTRWSAGVPQTPNVFSNFPWIEKGRYEDLLPAQPTRRRRDTSPDSRYLKIYHRYGSIRITSSPELDEDEEAPHHHLLDDAESSTLFDKAIQLICGFIHHHPHRKFALEIHWECDWVCDPKPIRALGGSEPSNSKFRKSLLNKCQKNFQDQEYISRRDQSAFQEYEVVKDLVYHDHSLSHLGDDGKEDLVDKIIIEPSALKLLLNCVLSGFPLEVLHHIIFVHGAHDQTQQQPDIRNCDHEDCSTYVPVIWAKRTMFHVRNIERDFGHHLLPNSEVVPLQYTGKDNRAEKLGDGASGNVYKVRIDSAHHYLSGDPLCSFALKKFSAGRQKEFDQERSMLKVLADNPQPCIVPHITSWSQKDDHFILYPKARYNLRQFMQNVEPVKFTRHETLWFLKQLEGLALAIAHVHDMKIPTNTQPEPSEGTFWGCHFDIKPENILVFEKVHGQHPRFRIADFGVGVFHPAGKKGAHSELTSEAHGTVTYFAPDKEITNKVSRPFDMWALGCVYLELMAWLFGFFQGIEGFSTARFNCTGADVSNRNDRFWYMKQGTPRLLPTVENVMRELKIVCCPRMPAFLGVLEAVDHLLEINDKTRWKAETLKEHMARIIKEADALLEIDRKFYHSQYEANSKAKAKADYLAGDFLRSTPRIPGVANGLGTGIENPSFSLEQSRSRQPRQVSQADRAANAVVQTGSKLDATLTTNRGRSTSGTSLSPIPRSRPDSPRDPLAEDLDAMVNARPPRPAVPRKPSRLFNHGGHRALYSPP
ncbi:hypothetical protein LTR84_007308 [Exophiala bonariae]|uniref:Protein kinase domain-containing protein n=1 Tax=Exophiala bonariae TaxID=1690606 RepID=A0AAV9N267_9EURO|nr:hypothetical protein LTR84_007308 [Exophiala bonariae]